jgi:two-component system, LuxR family, sensor kinase FixL
VLFVLVHEVAQPLAAIANYLSAIRRLLVAGMLEISIADRGPGLPDEVRGRLFEPFVTTKPTGMGIGLSLCHAIIETHGG